MDFSVSALTWILHAHVHSNSNKKHTLQNQTFNKSHQRQLQQISFINTNTHTRLNNKAWRCSRLTLLCSHASGSAVLIKSETKAISFTVHGHAHKHINTQMYTSEPGHKLINTYVTQMRKKPLREGRGNFSLSHINTSAR